MLAHVRKHDLESTRLALVHEVLAHVDPVGFDVGLSQYLEPLATSRSEVDDRSVTVQGRDVREVILDGLGHRDQGTTEGVFEVGVQRRHHVG